MCGISALIGGNPDEIVAMTDLIAHRGPDGQGYKTFDGEVTFGHRRLAIVDLTPSGHQPMSTGCGRYWVTYNGEIYNAMELRAELEALGHRFLGSSDTEVLLYAYKEWGEQCLQRFNGMFAFVLYDCAERIVFAARDRFGIKPLYIWERAEGQYAFASEIKQFTVLQGWRPAVNQQRAYDFLAWEVTDHTRETLFEGVSQLRGGQSLLMRVGSSPRISQWYNLPETAFNGSFEEASEQFRALLDDSVRLRLRADVEVGSCLSGGLDSSAIVCLANEQLRLVGKNQLQNTFSACSKDPRFDERKWVEKVIEQTGATPHFTYPSDKGLFKRARELVWTQDEPFVSTSIYAQWEVFRLAGEYGVKVMLDGQGADEHLAGYTNFLGRRSRELGWTSLLRDIGSKGWMQHVDLVLPEPLRQTLRRRLGKPNARPAWLNASSVRAGDPFLSYKGEGLRGFSRMQLLQSNLPKLLHWEDRNSMAHSVEARTPFLDYRLVEFVLSLPSHFKLEGGESKRVLREGLQGTVPASILARRDKMGFVTPEEAWLTGKGRDAFLAEVDRAIESSGGLIRRCARDEVAAIAAKKRPFSSLPWRIISFGHWVERFGAKITS